MDDLAQCEPKGDEHNKSEARLANNRCAPSVCVALDSGLQPIDCRQIGFSGQFIFIGVGQQPLHPDFVPNLHNDE